MLCNTASRPIWLGFAVDSEQFSLETARSLSTRDTTNDIHVCAFYTVGMNEDA